MRILVVDDSEDWRDLTEGALLAAGYDDIEQADGAKAAYEALALTARNKPAAAIDLVILDVVMPQIDGIEACARIRSDIRYADVPIIMVTSLQDMDSLANAFVAGATDYITKPFNRVELLARVRSALKLKAELDRRKARERELIALAQPRAEKTDDGRWIDPATGLFRGEAAEAYFSAAAREESAISVLALAVDRLEALRGMHGEERFRDVLTRVAGAVQVVVAPIGVTAAAYRDGVIVLVAPGLDAKAARSLGENLRQTISRLPLANPESITADGVTASVGVVSGRANGNRSRADFLADARTALRKAAAAGGNRVTSVDLSAV